MPFWCVHFKTRVNSCKKLGSWGKAKAKGLNWWIILFTTNHRNGHNTGWMNIWKYASLRSMKNMMSSFRMEDRTDMTIYIKNCKGSYRCWVVIDWLIFLHTPETFITRIACCRRQESGCEQSVGWELTLFPAQRRGMKKGYAVAVVVVGMMMILCCTLAASHAS